MENMKLLLIAFAISFSSMAMAQTSLSGTVLDIQNLPVPGPNILVKGTSNEAVTDFDGNNRINHNHPC